VTLPQYVEFAHDIGGALVCTVNDVSSRLLALGVDARNSTILSAAYLLDPYG
jgi:hypothetical protein